MSRYFDMITKLNPKKQYYWSYISLNPNITWDIIEENLEYPWEWWSLCKNPNVSIDFIEKNIDKLYNYDAIYKNKMGYDKYFVSDVYRKRKTKKFLNIIRDELVQKTCTPSRVFNWNEEIYEFFILEYNQECDKWRYRCF